MADILTLTEARGAIRLAPTDESRDADLASLYIPSATLMVEDMIGPVMASTRTWQGDGGAQGVSLGRFAITGVMSVTESGTALATTDYAANLSSAIVWRLASTSVPTEFASGVGNIAVTYTAGAYAATGDVPANIKLAARIILAHLSTDQQGFRPQFGQPDTSTTTTPSGYAVPNRAAELLGYKPNPGIA